MTDRQLYCDRQCEAWAVLAAALWAAFLMVGSLVPFQFDPDRWTPAIFALTTTASPASDLLINVLLYVPLGVFVALAFARFWPAALAVVVFSYGLECVQGAEPQRVGSWIDVATNVSTGLFAALATRWVTRPHKTPTPQPQKRPIAQPAPQPTAARPPRAVRLRNAITATSPRHVP